MAKTFPITEKPLPANLPEKLIALFWDDFGSSIICDASGLWVKFWPADRLIQPLPVAPARP